MLKEFKEFAVKGNLVDIAVAFVMGAAFGKIVTAFIDGIVMPLVGMLINSVDFKEMRWILKEGTGVKGADGKIPGQVAIEYGVFITNLVDFIIVAFCMFLVIKAINRLKKAEPEAAPLPAKPSHTEELLTEIRDSLKRGESRISE